MIIKSIELQNFRQYKGKQKVEFSTDTERNVTIIKGENGAGKTTLLEAFTWCFYNKVTLPNQNKLLTADVFNNMEIGESCWVYVIINFIHNEREYYINRKASYKKYDDGEPTRMSNSVLLQVKDNNGVLKEINSNEIEAIFPNDLSTYFFFDGERIENISKFNKVGKKDLNNAIRNILGLDVILNTQKHLKKVITEFEKDYNSEANSEMQKYTDEINELREELDELTRNSEDTQEEINCLEEKIVEIGKILQNYDEVKVFEKDREEKMKQLSMLNNNLSVVMDDIKKINKRGLPEFLAKRVLHLCSDKINLESLQSRGIVGIDGKAIDHLINRNRCICGQEIKAGTPYFNELIKQKEYQPPASLGTILNQFNEKSTQINNSADSFTEEIKKAFKHEHEYKSQIAHLEEQIAELTEKLIGSEKSKELEEERQSYIKDKESNNVKIGILDEKIKLQKDKISEIENKVKKLALDDDKNFIVARRKEYAEVLLSKIESFYENKENSIKEQLNETVTEIFNELLCTKHIIEIGEDYSFIVRDIDGEDSTSQGQDVITSFAFIGGIIKLAKEKHKDIEVNEPYPLIMDAPFAKLSKAHRKSVATLLPSIAEQFILITVDSQYEGDIEETLKNKIGNQYELIMHNENEKYTEIIRRG